MKQRNTIMDVAKALAMLAVIIGHTKYDDNVRMVLYTFHLPVFFIISGYFFNIKESFPRFFIKKTKAYVIPYVSFALIILLFNYWYSGYKAKAFKYNKERLIYQQRYTTLWFLTTLYIGILLFWLICYLCKKNEWLILIVSTTISVIATHFTSLETEKAYWNYDTSCIILVYFAVGYLFRKKDVITLVTKTKPRVYFALFASVFLCATLTTLNYTLTNKEYYELFHNHFGIYPLTTLAAVASSFAIFMLAHLLRNVKPLIIFGQNTMTYFALHQSVALELAKKWCKPLSPWLGKYILLFIITMGICFVIDYGIKHSPLKFMLGK
ncbi:MAG: acyltransferase family protein [Lachnospiraceae bacterium]|nr:acyltransferase family protein [Lachnospiraceae bacterium]